MITATDFEVVECQTALFTPGLQLMPARVLAALTEQWGGVFDADPVVLPHSDELPPEVPRLIVTSRDDRYRIQAGATRVDLVTRAGLDEPGLSLAGVVGRSWEILSSYLSMTNAIVTRVAAVIKRTALNPEPAQALARHFCKDEWIRGPLNRPQQFELHAHKVFRLPAGFDVNSWFRCKTVVLRRATDEPGVLVEQDFNTLPEPLREFTSEEIVAFLSSVPPEFDHVLHLYFPLERAHAEV